jgi:hypothetical protein
MSWTRVFRLAQRPRAHNAITHPSKFPLGAFVVRRCESINFLSCVSGLIPIDLRSFPFYPTTSSHKEVMNPVLRQPRQPLSTSWRSGLRPISPLGENARPTNL